MNCISEYYPYILTVGLAMCALFGVLLGWLFAKLTKKGDI